MNVNITENDKICRACLATKESFTYYLFKNVPPEMYSFCTSLEVLHNDDLPKSLCRTCYEILQQLSEFKQTCIASYNSLIKYKVESTTKVESSSRIEDPEADIVGIEPDDSNNFNFGDLFFKTETHLSDKNGKNNKDEEVYTAKTLAKIKKRLKKSKQLKMKIKIQTESKTKLKVSRKPFDFACNICNKKFAILERLESHKKVHVGKNHSITCEVCNKVFKTWNGLSRHRETEHTIVNLDTLKCKTCGKIFKSKQTLKAHQLTHSARPLTICDICGKVLKSAVILKMHLETHKENRQRQYSCQYCGKKFYTNTTLSTHVTRRHTTRRYICHLCCYPFSDKFNLSKHLMAHQGIKPYKCEICNQSYSSQSFLTEHKRIHSGEKPYKCDMCTKSFISKKRLVDHLRTHTGEKPYKCNVCTQAFTQRGTLNRHMRVHDKLIIGI